MDDKELVRYVSQGNKTTEMDTMAYMNAVDELCERFEKLHEKYMWSKGETWPYKWMDDQQRESDKEMFDLIDQEILKTLISGIQPNQPNQPNHS